MSIVYHDFGDLMTYMGLVLLSYSLVESVEYFPMFGPQLEPAMKITFQGDSSTRFFNIRKCSIYCSLYTLYSAIQRQLCSLISKDLHGCTVCINQVCLLVIIMLWYINGMSKDRIQSQRVIDLHQQILRESYMFFREGLSTFLNRFK